MAAIGWNNDKSETVAVPALGTANTFTGTQTFSGTVDSTSTDTGTVIIAGGLGVQGNLYAAQVWGAYWNDLTDCIEVPSNTDLKFGCAYCFDGEKYYKSTKYMDDGFIGIHSDTSGFCMGKKDYLTQMHTAVAGFVLAYVDNNYEVGTPLTITENGWLTKMRDEDIADNPHKIVATFWKDEPNEKWGPEGKQIFVDNRKWVKVK